MTLGITNTNWVVEKKVETTFALDASYPNPAGYPLLASTFGLSRFNRIEAETTSGYVFQIIYGSGNTSAALHALEAPGGGGGGVTGATSAGTPAGTNGTSAVTGTGAGSVTPLGSNGRSSLDLAAPIFSGTGLTAAGQVITTTDNQTMALNACAGMWLISATGATSPNLILSNTATTLTPAVLTVQGSANTDAGAYSIVNNASQLFTGASSAVTVSSLSGTAAAQTFSGSALATHTHTVSGSSTAGPLVETANATDLSAITNINVTIYGY